MDINVNSIGNNLINTIPVENVQLISTNTYINKKLLAKKFLNNKKASKLLRLGLQQLI